MLGKLFKYEMKSTARTFLPFFAAILAFSLINKLTTLFFSGSKFFDIPQALLMATYILLIAAAFVMCFIVSIQRFYKNLLGPEGYLMFTLPVTTSANILSKALAAIIWFLSTIATTLVSVLIVVPDYKWIAEVGNAMTETNAELSVMFGYGWGTLITILAIFFFLAFVAFVFQVYTSISLGQLSNNHKLAVSFGAYIAVYALIQIVSSVLLLMLVNISGINILGSISLTDLLSPAALAPVGSFTTGLFLGEIGLQAILSVVFFFMTRHLLGKRLNLE